MLNEILLNDANNSNVLDEIDNLMKKKILTTNIIRENFKSQNYSGELITRLTIHITSNCNLKCKHCYVSEFDNCILQKEQIDQLFDDINNMNILNLSITGGEPFLYPENLEYIADKCHKFGVRIENIFTNGTLLHKNKKTIEKLIQLFDITFYVSVDGLEDTYNNFRGKEGSFKELETGLLLLEELDVKFFANIIINKSNYNHMIEIYHYLMKYKNLKRLRIDGGFNLGNWEKNKEFLELDIFDEVNSIKKLVEIWNKEGKQIEFEYGHLFRHLFGRTYLLEDLGYSPNSLCCEYYKSVCVIFPDGSVTPCGLTYPHYVCGSIFESSLQEIWMSPKMRYFKELKIQDLGLEECKECVYLDKCGSGCRGNALLNGESLQGMDNEICRLFKKGIYTDFEEFIKKVVLDV
jgi:radical SAM protein with 4Fe4S-binding SPASM domain